LIGIRWSILSAIIPTFIFFFGRPNACSAALIFIWATYTICWSFCSLLFLVRVCAIYNFDRRVMGFFFTLWIGVIGVWIACTCTYRGAYIPSIPAPQPYCAEANDSSWHPVSWGASMLFDTCILLFTVYKLNVSKSVIHGAKGVDEMRRFIVREYLMEQSL